VTKNEIVDCSEVLASLNQMELEALHFYKVGVMPAIFPSEWASGAQRHNAMLLFGRYLWDPEFAFDPAVFRNPQLKITLNKAAIRAASATGFATGDNIKVSVIAKVMENMGSRPSRYLMPKQIVSWTSGTSGEKRLELPIDFPYRLMLLRAYVEGSDTNECITDLKLTCDTDKYVMLNRKLQQIDAEALGLFGTGRVKHDFLRATGAIARTIFNKEASVHLALWSNAIGRMIGISNTWSSQVTIGMFSDATTGDATARNLSGIETGHAPHAITPLPFGLMSKEDSWFNPKEYGKIEAVVTEAVAATCSVLLEQVRPNMKLG